MSRQSAMSKQIGRDIANDHVDETRKEYHILSLGAGVQSTVLYLMSLREEIVKFDAAIFADTQEEPEAVYRHLEWLMSLGGPPIIARTAGKLGDDLLNGTLPSMPNGVEHHEHYQHRFSSIPAFTAMAEGFKCGIVKRQCTYNYKVAIVEQAIRRDVLGLKKGQRIPKDTLINQYMGLSFDEPSRAARTKARFKSIRWGEVHFPLFDEMMTRGDCLRWLDDYGIPHQVPRSACVFCPFKNNREWKALRDNDPQGWQRAVEIDEGLRTDGSRCNRGLNQSLYLHVSCVPLKDVKLDDGQLNLFDQDCEGGCGL